MNNHYTIKRDENGIPHIDAETENAMFYAQGYAHAKDRGMQLLLMKILGEGRLAEFLDPSEQGISIDHFFRRMNWYNQWQDEVDKLSKQSREKLESYVAGINARFSKSSPLDLKLLGYKIEPWRLQDSILISRMVGYLTLAQSQGEIERLIIEMIQAGVSKDKLEELFPNQLNELDYELVQKIELEDRIVSNQLLWESGAPRMMASNNWVISGKKSKSGQPILVNDPHLEVNRLPNVWYEMKIAVKDHWIIGSSMPGLPGILIGRNKHLAWGATYAFVDTIDSWIERCEDGKYWRLNSQSKIQEKENKGEWHLFKKRKEIIKIKGNASKEVYFYENELGTLEGDPNSTDGKQKSNKKTKHLLITCWAAANSGAKSIEAVFTLLNIDNVKQAMKTYGQVETGWNYIFADNQSDSEKTGNIGYQMSGKVPIRRKGISGLIPLPAWETENHWQGYIAIEDMPQSYNPEINFIGTANEDLNHLGKANPINIPMGSYRSDRIAYLLSKKNDWTVKEMGEMHFDVYSLQAEIFMPIISPLLPSNEYGDILRAWDFNYNKESKGAFLFEEIYKNLYKIVFGVSGFGEAVVEFLQKESGMFIDFYDNFDQILLKKESTWFDRRTQKQLFKRAIDTALAGSIKEWREVQNYNMNNILFAGKLPKFLGFDKGPISAIGGRATIHQGQVYRSGNRDTTFMPSFRMIADFSETSIHTNLAGGPSDRRFSKWYTSDLDNWLKGVYKEVESQTDPRWKQFS
ncbi:MAG: penicillin acylase family protein [Kangiella sp.]|nr:MAG: penicillin acylase family protein [Kangiella sp.]